MKFFEEFRETGQNGNPYIIADAWVFSDFEDEGIPSSPAPLFTFNLDNTILTSVFFYAFKRKTAK
jgi:hypothetical protein